MALILPRHFFYATVVFVFFITAIVATLSMVTEDSPTGVPDLMESDRITEFNRTFYPEDFQSNVGELQDKLEGLEVEQGGGIISVSIAMISSAWTMVKFIITSFGFMDDSLTGMSALLGVPVWVPPLIIMFLIILFVFSILTIIFGKES